jgi:hypothetical protein
MMDFWFWHFSWPSWSAASDIIELTGHGSDTPLLPRMDPCLGSSTWSSFEAGGQMPLAERSEAAILRGCYSLEAAIV